MIRTEQLSVTVSVRGRFHAFDLARELQRRGALRKLITTYPKFKVREWSIPNRQISSLSTCEVLNRLLSRAPLATARRESWRVRLAEQFDRLVERVIPSDTRLFVGWSSECVQSIRRAKALGARTIVERGSAHISFQQDILAAEHDRIGVRWDGIHPRFIERSITEYTEADCICVPTVFARDTFVQCGISIRKLVVIPYGCDISVFQPVPKRDKIFRVIHCGQISVQKGAHILIRAFAELKLPAAELWLIGRLTPEIGSILKHYADANIKVKGPFSQSSLPRYYSQGSVFCIASFQEGLAMVIPQALACGLPVIATPNSGAADVIEDGRTGFLVPAGNVEALKEKLLLLYNQPALLKDMADCVSTTSVDLSWSRYGDRIVEAYQAVLQ